VSFIFQHAFLPVIVSLSCIYISQGSVVTKFRCGGILDIRFIASCIESVPVKKILKIG